MSIENIGIIVMIVVNILGLLGIGLTLYNKGKSDGSALAKIQTGLDDLKTSVDSEIKGHHYRLQMLESKVFGIKITSNEENSG